MPDISDADLEGLEEEFAKTLKFEKFEKYGKFGTLLYIIVMSDAQPRAQGPLTTCARSPNSLGRRPANRATAFIKIDWEKLEPADCGDDRGLFDCLSILKKIEFIKFGFSVWEKSGRPTSGHTFEHFAVENPEDTMGCSNDDPEGKTGIRPGGCCIFNGPFGSMPPGCLPC